MMTKALTILAIVLSLALPVLAQQGPAAKQVYVNTNNLEKIAPTSTTLQNVLDSIDANMIFDGDGYLSEADAATTYLPLTQASTQYLAAADSVTYFLAITNAATTYASLTANNLFTSGSTQQVSTVEVRGELYMTAAGTLAAVPTTPTVTNAGTLTLAGSSAVATPYGQAAAGVCAVSLAAPAVAGQMYVLSIDAAATNSMAVLTTGNYVGTAFTNAAGTARLLFAPTASTWISIGN